MTKKTDNNKKKAAIIVQHLAKGGAEASAARLSIGLSNLGYDVTLIIFHSLIEYEYKGNIISLNIDFLEKNLLQRIFLFFKKIRTVSRIKKQNSFYTCISFMENANFINILSKQKEKLIVSTRNDIELMLKSLPFYKKFFMKTLYKKVFAYVLISKKMKQDAVKLLKIKPDKTKLLYNPINNQKIKDLAGRDAGKYSCIFKHPVLVNSGRLSGQKGQWHLIRIMKILLKDFKELKLILLGYGDGDLKEYLVNLSRTLGLKTYAEWENASINDDYDVYFTGFLKNPYSLIARSKIFLFPSISEGLGNALIEAMICAVPVISSDCKTGPRDILAPDTDCNKTAETPEHAPFGILMPPFNDSLKTSDEITDTTETMWINTIKELLNNNEKREMYALSAEKRGYDFDVHKIIQGWTDIIESE
ncbi:MAG: glycosyltransferase [Candidatus Goldbacteria bacterium]|nr:glycosyltransferase [Candidatus Goldiibacteriota bacterium]